MEITGWVVLWCCGVVVCCGEGKYLRKKKKTCITFIWNTFILTHFGEGTFKLPGKISIFLIHFSAAAWNSSGKQETTTVIIQGVSAKQKPMMGKMIV